ncbi:MAG: glycosyltransferase family 4 protein [Chloroflexi bacterium]|nr:glycosyltransferase family 4 protein [Chloroflexota bacterium]
MHTMIDARSRPLERRRESLPETATWPVPRRKVVFVQPTSEVGGSDIALYRLVTALDSRRLEPVVVLPREGPLTGRLRQAGVRVVILPMAQLRSTRNPIVHLKYLVGFLPSMTRLAFVIRRERAQVVHSNSLYTLHGAWAAWFARVPHVWHIREIPDAPAPVRFLLLAMARRLSSRIVAMTGAVAAMFDRGGHPRDKSLLIVPDGIDLARFNPAQTGERIRRELSIRSDAPVAGFVARLDPWKGAEIFIRAAAEVSRRRPDAHYIVCGGRLPGYESYADGLRQLAADLHLDGRMHFTEWAYTVDDIPEVMAAIDVLVHTSIRPEPFGLVLIEAMAAGKPVVAADDGGVPEIVVDGETGLLAPPGDWRAVAGAVARLFDDRASARAFGAAGRSRAERLFGLDVYARRIEAVYAGLIRTREVPA